MKRTVEDWATPEALEHITEMLNKGYDVEIRTTKDGIRICRVNRVWQDPVQDGKRRHWDLPCKQ